jgi:hypothetical protein
MTDFGSAWIVSSISLVVLAIAIGRAVTKKWAGVLIDGRGRYSLTHFQTVTWTLAILSAYVAALVSSSFSSTNLLIDSSLLQLMGIAASSAVLATGVKSIKDASGSAAGSIASDGKTITRLDNSTTIITAKLPQIWLEEEGSLADLVVNITKFQNFIFTLVALGVFIALAIKAQKLPILPENLVWLLGISHAGYVGGKVPDKTK